MTHPLEPEAKLQFDGPESFWVLTFSTGLIALSGNIGLDLMAIRLGFLEFLCIYGLTVVKNRVVWSPALVIYSVYLLWLIIGITYGPSVGYGIRVILKYLYPFVIALFASAAVRDFNVWLKSAKWARLVGGICLVFSFVPYISLLIPGVLWYSTARAIHFISLMVLSMGLYYFTDRKRQNLIWAVAFLLPCFIWVFRTSIMGSLVAIMAFYFIRYRLRSLPIILGVLVAGVMAVFFIPSLHEKMFKTSETSIEQFQDGQVTMENVNTNARQAMWEHLEKRFYKGHELVGSGTASVQEYMYTHRIFGGLKVPHSDLVQIKCDNGLIALIMYAVIAALMFMDCFTTYWHTSDPRLRLAAIVAGASIAGTFVTMYSDNVVNYSMATLSMPFGFYGMMLGIKRKLSEE